MDSIEARSLLQSLQDRVEALEVYTHNFECIPPLLRDSTELGDVLSINDSNSVSFSGVLASSAPNIPIGTGPALEFNFSSVYFDTDNYFNPLHLDRLTVPTSDYYFVGGITTYAYNPSFGFTSIDTEFITEIVAIDGKTGLVVDFATGETILNPHRFNGIIYRFPQNLYFIVKLNAGDYIVTSAQMGGDSGVGCFVGTSTWIYRCPSSFVN